MTFAYDLIEAMDFRGKLILWDPKFKSSKLSNWSFDLISFSISTDFPNLTDHGSYSPVVSMP